MSTQVVDAVGLEGWVEECVHLAELHWGASVDVVASGRDVAELFSLEALDHIVSTQLLRTPSQVRLRRDGVAVPIESYSSTVPIFTNAERIVDAANLLNEIQLGATAIFLGLQRYSPTLNTFATRLAHDLGHATAVNGYLSTAGEVARRHHDAHDVIAIQIAGTKRWVLEEPERPNPTEVWTEDTDIPVRDGSRRELEMSPGDVLYVPRGLLHSTATHDLSLHLTISIDPPSWGAVLGRLIDAAIGRSPALRTSVPPRSADVCEWRSGAEQAIAELGAFLRAQDASGISDAVLGATQVSPLLRPGHLRAMLGADPWDDASLLGLRERARTRLVEVEPGVVSLQQGDRRLDLPQAVRPVLHLLLERAVSVVEARRLAPDADELLSVLWQAAFIERVPDDGS